MSQQFYYLGSIIDSQESSTANINSGIGKVRKAFYQLRKAWASNQYSRWTKTRIYQSNVLSVLLYGSQCWKISKKDGDRLTHSTSDTYRKYRGYSGPILYPTTNCIGELKLIPSPIS